MFILGMIMKKYIIMPLQVSPKNKNKITNKLAAYHFIVSAW